MRCWQVEQLRLVNECVGDTQTFSTVVSEAQRLGFEFCSFGMKSPVPLVAPKVAWCSNYPPAWQARYNECQYLRVDPTVAHAIVSDESVVWSDEVFAACPDLRREAGAHGLVHGWAQPRRDARGMVSLLTLARREPPLEPAELAHKADRLQWLSHLCHEGMLKAWGQVLAASVEGELTAREREVLRWSCEGKTSSEVAQILGVTEATVNFHTRAACAKLGATNRTAAAVRAALMGLLW